VLWDLDGTLIDTEDHWVTAQSMLADSWGAAWTSTDVLATIGRPLAHTAARLQRNGVGLPVDQIVEKLRQQTMERLADRVPWRPGGLQLLDQLHARGTPCALVTMSDDVFVASVLARLPRPYFATVVTRDMVDEPKPHPRPYQLAAELLGVAPRDCLAVEDSPAGVQSAEAAGMPVLALQGAVLLSGGSHRHVVTSLADLDLDEVWYRLQHEPTADHAAAGIGAAIDERMTDHD
jgi:HAD superfamily hydrolase (TIGR01509 family)